MGKLFVSFEDKVEDDSFSGYRELVFDFLRKETGLEVDENSYGQTRISTNNDGGTWRKDDGWYGGSKATEIEVCGREGVCQWRFTFDNIRYSNTRSSKFYAGHQTVKSKDGIPVFVIDSDGIDPEYILNYSFLWSRISFFIFVIFCQYCIFINSN